jgi:hypothetical protein
VDDRACAASWKNWTSYTGQALIDPYMRHLDKPLKQTYMLAFAAQVRSGIFGHGIQVGAQSVEKALCHVAQTLLLVGYNDPRRTYRAKELDLPFRHLLKSYCDSVILTLHPSLN